MLEFVKDGFLSLMGCVSKFTICMLCFLTCILTTNALSMYSVVSAVWY